jgi:hypothetical protein
MDLNKEYKKTGGYCYSLAKQIRFIFSNSKECVLKELKFERDKKSLSLLPTIIKYRENTVNIVKGEKCADMAIKHGIITATPASAALTNCCVLNNMICNPGFLSHEISVLGFGFIHVVFLSYFTGSYVHFGEKHYRVFPYRENLYRKNPMLKIILLRVKKFSHGFG